MRSTISATTVFQPVRVKREGAAACANQKQFVRRDRIVWTLAIGLTVWVVGCKSAQSQPESQTLASVASLGTPTVAANTSVASNVRPDDDPFGASRDLQTMIRMASTQTSLSHPVDDPWVRKLATPMPTQSAKETNLRFRNLTEAEMLSLAMQHSSVIRSLGVRVLQSPTSVTTVYDPAIRASDPFFGPAAALAEFDGQINASLTTQNNDRVFNNATLGGQVQELVQDFAQFESGWRRRTTMGTQWDLRSIHLYDSNNRAGNSFPSYWETQLELGVRQPLLQGAGRTFNLIAGPNARPGLNFSNGIWIARINNQLSQADFEIQLRDYLFELYTAYWELHRQYESYASIEEARNLSFEIWQTVRSKKESGLTGGEAYKEAQTRGQFYRYQRDAQLAMGGGSGESGIRNAERTLRRLIGLPVTDGQLLRPADAPAAARFTFAIDDHVARATKHRTELRRQRLEVRQRKLRLVAAKNFLLPQLDVIGRTRVRGFGDDLTGGGPRFASASDDLFSFDHTELEFGVEMGVSPLRRQAKAAVRNATLQLHRERSILEEQQRAVTFEIHDAIAETSSSYEAMQSSLARVEAGIQRLASSRALYDAGKIDLEFLIDATDDLLQAKRQLCVDQSRYSLSLIQVSRSTGTLLGDVGVRTRDGCLEDPILSEPPVGSPSLTPRT